MAQFEPCVKQPLQPPTSSPNKVFMSSRKVDECKPLTVFTLQELPSEAEAAFMISTTAVVKVLGRGALRDGGVPSWGKEKPRRRHH